MLRSLRTRLVLLALVAMLPVLVLLFLASTEERRSAEAGVQQQALRLVRQVVREQEGLLARTGELLVAMAAEPAIAIAVVAIAAAVTIPAVVAERRDHAAAEQSQGNG